MLSPEEIRKRTKAAMYLVRAESKIFNVPLVYSDGKGGVIEEYPNGEKKLLATGCK